MRSPLAACSLSLEMPARLPPRKCEMGQHSLRPRRDSDVHQHAVALQGNRCRLQSCFPVPNELPRYPKVLYHIGVKIHVGPLGLNVIGSDCRLDSTFGCLQENLGKQRDSPTD